ncbi:MAG: SMP-30/gluconolactonase/LRE family protein [Pirellulaceae bacterium]|nr:SMP-30/gluconolactonase/LRE family protein [Pirellulaceae bacterium]
MKLSIALPSATRSSATRRRVLIAIACLCSANVVGLAAEPLPEPAAEPIEPALVADNSIVAEGSKLELIYTRQAKLNSGLTEGPAVAADGSIYFTDMPFGTDNGMILRYDPKTNQTTVFTDNSGKSNGLAFLRDGTAVSCDGADGGGRRLVRWNLKTKEGTTLVDRFQGKRFNSPNDLVVDLKGRIYFTDPRYGGSEPRELEREAVYRLDTDGKVIEITRDVEKPNGIVLSPDQRTLYVGDHNNGGNRLKPTDPEPKRGAMKIYAFPLDADGLVNGPRKTLVDFGTENGCDGMTVDSLGNLYASSRSLARPGIKVVDPDGKELVFVETGPRNQTGLFDDWQGIPSNVEFGIGDDANSLYITIDKSLYRLKVKTRGFHPHLDSK